MLLTGCTGFLGKVVLEKMIRSLPEIGRIYVLVRPKQGKNPLDRIKNEIFSSYCFERAKREIPNFHKHVEEKIVGIEGDIVKDNLGLSA